MFRQIKSKLLAAFAVPMAILVAVAGLAISSTLSQTKTAKDEREAALLAVVGLAGALLGLLLVIRVSRAVSRPLADLAKQAQYLATVSLPATVETILDADATGGDLPEVPEVRTGNLEEVAAVANALQQLNQTAVELASGQAALRRNLSDAFVNLGRRNQNLVTRQLEYITEIELKEADPTSLEELFRLDHLATRMRRNAESLLILAGSGPARQWNASVPVMDVARAASAEVEDYKRLRLHHFDPALVTGVVTTDLVHILAELIENALSFSPPGAPVDVYGRFLEGAYVIVIVDTGIGMSSEDLAVANERLEGVGANGEVPGRYLGHFVAGRLAARHGIAISLQPSHSGGLVARVKVPAPLLEEAVADLSAGAEVRPPAPIEPSVATGTDASTWTALPSPSPVSETLLGLAGSTAASSSSDNGIEAVHSADEHEENVDGRSYHNGSTPDSHEDLGRGDELGAAPSDDGAEDFGAVWVAKMAALVGESPQPSPEADDSTAEVHGAEVHGAEVDMGAVDEAGDVDGAGALDEAGPEVGNNVEPFDWARQAEPTSTSEPLAITGPAPVPEVGTEEPATVQAVADRSYSAAPAGYLDGPDSADDAPYVAGGEIVPGHSWDPIAAQGSQGVVLPANVDITSADGAESHPALVTPDSPLPGTSDHPVAYSGTPDLNASAPLAGALKDAEGNHFRPDAGLFDQDAVSDVAREAMGEPGGVPNGFTALAVTANRASFVGSPSAAGSWGPASVSAPAQPAVGPPRKRAAPLMPCAN